MQALECHKDLSCIKYRPALSEAPLFFQVVKKFSTIEEIKNEVELGRGLESEMQFHYERIIYLLKDFSLSYTSDE